MPGDAAESQERLPDLGDDVGGRRGTDVGEQEPPLQFVEKLLIDAAGNPEQRRDVAEDFARPRQTLFQFPEDGFEDHSTFPLGSRRRSPDLRSNDLVA